MASDLVTDLVTRIKMNWLRTRLMVGLMQQLNDQGAIGAIMTQSF